MERLSPKLQYSNVEMDEAEIEATGTAWFQFARTDKHLILIKFAGSPAHPDDITTEVIKSGRPDTFQLMSNEFAKCGRNVYFFGAIKRKMDSPSFRLLQRSTSAHVTHWVWSADNQNVYRYDTIKKGLDGSSFRRLNDFWACDKNTVFCFATQRLYPKIDAGSFQVGPDGTAFDKDFSYEVVPNTKTILQNTPITDCFDDPSFTRVVQTRR